MNSVHVDENEDHGWVVGQFDRGMDGERVAVRARWVPMKCQWLRDGVTIVEVVSTVLKHQNGHVDKTHYDDFIAARSRQGLNSLNSIVESHSRTRALGSVVTGCNQRRTGSLLVEANASRNWAWLVARRHRRLA